jgi:hypothetical protein
MLTKAEREAIRERIEPYLDPESPYEGWACTVSRLLADLDAAYEALEPFAELYAALQAPGHQWPDDTVIYRAHDVAVLTVGALRRAAGALGGE